MKEYYGVKGQEILDTSPESTIEDLFNDIEIDEYYDYPTEKMKKAAADFIKVIKSEYKPWMCEPTGEVLKFSKENVLGIL